MVLTADVAEVGATSNIEKQWDIQSQMVVSVKIKDR
jgi:hypothetical protein